MTPSIIKFYNELSTGQHEEAANTLAVALSGRVLKSDSYYLVVNGGLHFWENGKAPRPAGDPAHRAPVVTSLNPSRAKDLPAELQPIYQAFEIGRQFVGGGE